MKKVYILILTAFVGVVAIIVMSPKAYAYEYNDTVDYAGKTYNVINEYKYLYTPDYNGYFSYQPNYMLKMFDIEDIIAYGDLFIYNYNDVKTNIPDILKPVGPQDTYIYLEIVNINFGVPIEVIYKTFGNTWITAKTDDDSYIITGITLTYTQEWNSFSFEGGYNIGFLNKNGSVNHFKYIDGIHNEIGLAVRVDMGAGYEAGWRDGNIDGYNEGYNVGNGHGYLGGFSDGETYGYNQGVNSKYETDGFGILLSSGFTALGALLAIELIPNISIGALVSIPIVFGVIMFIIGRRKD